VGSYDALRELPLRIERVELETLEHEVARDFTLARTVVRLCGGGEEGVGEDVTYQPELHAGPPLAPVEGEWTLDAYSRSLDGFAFFGSAQPADHAATAYRRWAWESAALDLALRQAGRSLGEVLEREPKPLRFVVSTRASTVEGWASIYPELHFKLDPDKDWSDELIDALAARKVVDTADFKGVFRGTFGQHADVALYRRIAEAFPAAYLEDPELTPESDEALRPHRNRVTWDAAIHSWSDVEALPFAPRTLNCKPSRFGSLARLLEFYDRCAENGIGLYGGGQFELGPGRGQIQLLAALFHPDAPNDVAPAVYNDPQPRPGLPTSPLRLDPEPTGFRLRSV